MHLVKERESIEFINIAKALGIISVVIGHAESPISSLIYLYHMALFFFISGYLYNDSYSDKPILFIKKRIQSLYIPFIKYQLIFLFLHNIFVLLNIYNPNIIYSNKSIHLYDSVEFIKNFIIIVFTFGITEQLAGSFWFFISLFTVSILFCLTNYFLNKFIQKHKEYMKCIIIVSYFVVGNIVSLYYGNLPRMIDTSLVAILIYYFGNLYNKYEKFIPLNKYLLYVSVVNLLINSLYGYIYMDKNSYSSPAFFIINSILGIYINIYFAKLIAHRYNNKLLQYIGKNTVIILAFHFLAFKLVSLIQILIYKYPSSMLAKFPVISGSGGWWIIYSIIGVFLPILVKYILDKVKQKIFNLYMD